MFTDLRCDIRDDLVDLETRLTDRITRHMDAALQAALGRLSDKVGSEGTRIIGATAKETGEIKVALKGVAQQIRDGLNPADAVAAIDSAADGIGALGDQLVAGIDQLSDAITIDNAAPDAPATDTSSDGPAET